jgi:mono/diheme cytochrome c family protein
MQDPGAIVAFTYSGEGDGVSQPEPPTVSGTKPTERQAPRAPIPGAIPPRFTAAQVAAGKTAYNASCAVCHGSTLRNGTMGTPLAGEYFRRMWAGRTVKELFDRAHKTMPPAAPASLSADTYASIVAWILEVNGAKPGDAALQPGGEALEKMVIPER